MLLTFKISKLFWIFVVSELPKTQNKETMNNPIITTDKYIQLTTKSNRHYRSKAVQTRCQSNSITTSPFKATKDVVHLVSLHPSRLNHAVFNHYSWKLLKQIKEKFSLKIKNQIGIFLVLKAVIYHLM